jgi:hypothetical protein
MAHYVSILRPYTTANARSVGSLVVPVGCVALATQSSQNAGPSTSIFKLLIRFIDLVLNRSAVN